MLNYIALSAHHHFMEKRRIKAPLPASAADFVGAVSHDLKNPLAGIKLYAELAKERAALIGDKESLDLIKGIEELTQRAIHQVSELLDTTRISSGKIILDKEKLNLDMLVRQTLKDFQITAPKYKIHKKVNSGCVVYADKEKIRRVLLNLLTNAVKYSPGANEILVSVVKNKHEVIVSVQDFGVGIPKSAHKHLFDPYFRIKEKGKYVAAGYGLGLPIVKRILESHHGKAWYESTLGKGSTFHFSLPL